MPRYTVCMQRTVVEYATVEIEAESERDARTRALKVADFADWETAFDTYGEAEVVDVDTLPDDDED